MSVTSVGPDDVRANRSAERSAKASRRASKTSWCANSWWPFGRPARIDRPVYRGYIPALVIPGCTAVVLEVLMAMYEAAGRVRFGFDPPMPLF
jgi:hypothetical protein